MMRSTNAEGAAPTQRGLGVVENHIAAAHDVRANLISSPELRLRSKRGKLLLAISRRIEWPRRNTLLVAQRSIVIW